MKKGRFLWSAQRITEKQKAGKARNIKEKQLKNSRSTVSKQLVALHSFQRDNYLERDNRIMFTNPGKSRFSGVFLYPNGLICFKVKFLKSLKPQNDASSFFDLDSMQKAKICVDHFRGVPCISCGENSFAIFWLTMSKSHSILAVYFLE